jgi:hypothetical protein
MACQTDEPQYPQLNSLQALGGSNWSYGDTLTLQFDAMPMQSYKLALLAGAELIPIKYRENYRSDDFIEVLVFWDNRYLENGRYDIRLQVFNDGVGASDFLSVNYSGLNLKQTGFALLGENFLEIQDTSGGIWAQYPLSKSFDCLMVSSQDSLLYLAAYANYAVEVRSLKDFSLQNTLPLPAANGSQAYHNFLKTERGLFLLQTDGGIVYVEQGGIKASTNVAGIDRSARQASAFNDKLAIISTDFTGGNPKLEIYNKNLNGLLQSYPLIGSNYRVFALNNTSLGLSYFNGVDHAFAVYNVPNQQLTTSNLSLAQLVEEALAFNENSFVHADAQSLSRTTYLGSYQTTNIAQGPNYQNFQKNRVNEGFYLQNGNSIQRLLVNNNLQFAASYTNLLLDYEFLYNK